MLDSARVLVRQRHLSVAAVISELARQALRRPAGPEEPRSERSGLPLLPINTSGCVVDLTLVNQLRDDES